MRSSVHVSRIKNTLKEIRGWRVPIENFVGMIAGEIDFLAIPFFNDVLTYSFRNTAFQESAFIRQVRRVIHNADDKEEEV